MSKRHTDLQTFISRFRARVDRSGECWLFTGKATRGSLDYGAIKLPECLGRGRVMESAHRVAFFLEHGYWPFLVRHSCDVPLCCRPSHLLEGTVADNTRDMIERGRARNGNIKLNPEIWATIQASTERSGVLASRYGVHAAHIRRIRRSASGMVYRP